MTGLITRPPLVWNARDHQTVSVTITPRAGLTLADYGVFTLTVWEDPLWDAARGGRSGAAKASADWADPKNDGWAVVATATGTVAGSVVAFVVDLPAGAGKERYVVGVSALGGPAGREQLRKAQWLTLLPSTAAA